MPMAELFCYDVDDSTGNIDFFYNVAGQLVTQSFFCHSDDVFLGLILGNIDGHTHLAVDLNTALKNVSEYSGHASFLFIPPLFNNQEEYDEFKARHEECKAPRAELEGYTGKCFLGVDAGSTTVKAVLLDEQGKLLDSIYQSNAGNPF